MKFSTTIASLLLVCFVSSTLADMYMHNPRGSNDRLNGQNANRDNGNRLFDSQNNGKGGYCWGPSMTFYEGSQLSIEWTNQHSCGGKSDCEIVIQFMCSGKDENDPDDQIRDGTTTTTIQNDGTRNNLNGDEYQYGMHESYQYYQNCDTRGRNQGLYIADRNVGNDARTTRQNNNGNRNGFECPEERDYYPYWGPSPWMDIAVLTSDTDRCDLYETESQNVKNKYECMDGSNAATEVTKQDCTSAGHDWKKTKSWGMDAPDCTDAPASRDNHLGNGMDISGATSTNSYNWTIPDDEQLGCLKKGKNGDCACVLRTRYNISTGDTKNWKIDSTKNGENSPLYQDPYNEHMGKNLSLALDTSQFGRTFQDRSHVFYLAQRPSDVADTSRIYNLNVRGKRGNIVQTYPATEYDFVPHDLHVRNGDYIHFQWTGCDNNPAGNAGEGTDQTDRSNIVQVKSPNHNMVWDYNKMDDDERMISDKKFADNLAFLGQENCETLAELEARLDDDDDIDRDVGNCYKLNKAGPYFDGGLHQMENTGEFHYMSTRNNNWTNRGQKATILVEPILPLWAIIVIAIAGAMFLAAGGTFAGMMYAKSHPHSQVAEFFDRF